MKKIIALMLVVCCVLSFAACKNKQKEPTPDDTPDNPVGGNVTEDKLTEAEIAAIAAIQAKVDASVPETARITVVLKAELDDLNAEYNVTYNLDGTATVVYSYEKFNSFSDDVFADDYKTTYTGTALVGADGTVIGNLDGVASVEAVTFNITLDHTKLSNVDVNANVLQATVKAADAMAVLGVDLGADAQVIVSIGSLGVTSILISYESEVGPVEIGATYTYYVAPEEDGEGEEVTE